MGLQDLGQDIPEIIAEAKVRWGKQKDQVTVSHDTLSTNPSYKDDFIQAGVAHTSKDIEEHRKKVYTCRKCKKSFKGQYWVKNSYCYVKEPYQAGWVSHLRSMFLSDDPELYLLEHPGREK